MGRRYRGKRIPGLDDPQALAEREEQRFRRRHDRLTHKRKREDHTHDEPAPGWTLDLNEECPDVWERNAGGDVTCLPSTPDTPDACPSSGDDDDPPDVAPHPCDRRLPDAVAQPLHPLAMHAPVRRR